MNDASIITSFVQSFDSDHVSSEASENDKNTLRVDVEMFFLAQIPRRQEYSHALSH